MRALFCALQTVPSLLTLGYGKETQTPNGTGQRRLARDELGQALWVTFKGENEMLKYENVTMYLAGVMFGVRRYDCRTLEVWEAPYAQWPKALHLKWRKPRKRKVRSMAQGYSPWVVVVRRTDAIEPDSSMVLQDDGSSISRYASCDDRYRTDFEAKLAGAGVEPLFTMGTTDKGLWVLILQGTHVHEACLASAEYDAALDSKKVEETK